MAQANMDAAKKAEVEKLVADFAALAERAEGLGSGMGPAFRTFSERLKADSALPSAFDQKVPASLFSKGEAQEILRRLGLPSSLDVLFLGDLVWLLVLEDDLPTLLREAILGVVKSFGFFLDPGGPPLDWRRPDKREAAEPPA